MTFSTIISNIKSSFLRLSNKKGLSSGPPNATGALASPPNLHLASRPHLTSAYRKGDTDLGYISGLAHFGAFVRMSNGEPGLISNEELALPGQDARAFKVGDQVQVTVLSFKESKGLFLTAKPLLAEISFTNFAAEHSSLQGEALSGRVKSVVDYGVFVTVAPGVDGLLHISSIPDISIYSKSSIGTSINVAIKSLDVERKRLQLRLTR